MARTPSCRSTRAAASGARSCAIRATIRGACSTRCHGRTCRSACSSAARRPVQRGSTTRTPTRACSRAWRRASAACRWGWSPAPRTATTRWSRPGRTATRANSSCSTPARPARSACCRAANGSIRTASRRRPRTRSPHATACRWTRSSPAPRTPRARCRWWYSRTAVRSASSTGSNGTKTCNCWPPPATPCCRSTSAAPATGAAHSCWPAHANGARGCRTT